MLPWRVWQIRSSSTLQVPKSVQTLEIFWATTGNLPEVTSSTPSSISSASSISSPLGQVEFLRRSTGPIRKPGFSLLQSSWTERRRERATRLQPTPRETSLPKTVSRSWETPQFFQHISVIIRAESVDDVFEVNDKTMEDAKKELEKSRNKLQRKKQATTLASVNPLTLERTLNFTQNLREEVLAYA